MRFPSDQERRHPRQLGVYNQGKNEGGKGSKEASYSHKSQTGLIVFRRNSIQSEYKMLKVQEKEAHSNVVIAEELLITAKRQWESRPRQAKHIMHRREGGQGQETIIKMMMEKQEKSSSIRPEILYWKKLTTILESLTNSATNVPLKLGLINYNKKITHDLENELWGLLTSVDVVPHFVPLQQVDQTWTWKDFYPEWIDEEEVFEMPKCPLLPFPDLDKNTTLDVVFAEVPCDTSSDWRRDVLRLYIQLSAAHVAANSHSSYVVLSSVCSPFPNLFTCKELVLKRGHLWLYKLDLPKLEKKLALPVGSCELAVPLKQGSLQEMVKQEVQERGTRREAYATILHSAEAYMCGAIALAHSIRRTGSKRDMVILVDHTTQAHHRQGLEEAGWQVLPIDRIRNPHALPDSYNEWNYSKLRLWQLTSYHKIIFLDSDVLVLRNIDFLFQSEEVSAAPNSRTIFNSGLMVVEPHNCTFHLLMSLVDSVVSYNGGDQGFLNEIFTWWHRLPTHMNFLKHFFSNSQDEVEEKTKLFGMEPPLLYVLHFLGYKPWLCFRDYDCSWHFPELRKFASDVAHATWWNNYDSMSPQLQQYCSLTRNQTDILSYDIAASKLSPNPDPHLHWQRSISDPRFLYPALSPS
ncbi:hypothetical protein GOP47_0001802 [Adiantum capillus-veneris]|uniref:Hexosyltransferase n=1 Tax=Adiantum capillus-veneris TaxID=13818 RepID=A0A9D4ZNL7_ADICA|nr:hypothetical protein GOP47_0001802 [Adiantum capillus-veneris]